MAYTDTFTGSNGDNLEVYSASWVSVSGGNTAEIQSNRVTSIESTNGAYYYNQTAAEAHYAKLKIVTLGGISGRSVGPAVRVQAGGNFYYSLCDGDGKTYNGQCITNSYTDWDAGQTNPVAGSIAELSIDQSTTTTVYYKVGGSTVATYTSKSTLSGGRFGLSTFSGGSGNLAEGDDWEGGDVGGTAFNQSATGGFTPAGAILKQDAKVLTGATTPAGALLKQDQKILTGATTPVGAILNQAGKVLAGAITPTGVVAALRTAYAILTGAITPAGTLVKETQRALTGAVTPVGALLNQAQKILSGDITPTSTLGTIKTFLLDLVGSITPTGNLLKETQKIFTGSITPVGSLLKEIQKAFSGSITPTGAFAGIKVAFVVLVGSITPTGNLLRETQKTLTGVVTPLGLITKLTGKLLDGILAPTGALVTLFVGAGTTMAQSTFKGMFRGMFRRMR